MFKKNFHNFLKTIVSSKLKSSPSFLHKKKQNNKLSQPKMRKQIKKEKKINIFLKINIRILTISS